MKAFPFLHKNPTSGITESEEGMDLRDWYAGLAMQALVQSKPNEFVAHIAFMYADEMMKEREKQDE
jgi:hypothetical protein